MFSKMLDNRVNRHVFTLKKVTMKFDMNPRESVEYSSMPFLKMNLSRQLANRVLLSRWI